MEKEMMKRKFGLPPLPSITTGAQTRRPLQRKKDYSPVAWDKYFEHQQDKDIGNGDTFRVYTCGSEGPVLLFLHGGGFSALSWALLSAHVTQMVKCRCLAVDLRGHGDTKTRDESNLSAEQMSNDVGRLVSHIFNDEPPPIVLIGHSMGGAIAVHTASRDLIPSLIGLAVIDVVEGTAMDALSNMQSFLRSRPRTFESIEWAIEWAVRSGHVTNLESAKVSMTGQVKILSDSEENIHNQGQSHGSVSDTISEEDEDNEEETSPSGQVVHNAAQPQSNHKFTWRIDLSKTEPFWKGWFQGLSQKFLSCKPPKMLILAGADRLDKELTIGQMQGKFQMNILPQSGHAVQEDVPDKVADIIAAFLLRHKAADAIDGYQRDVPSCLVNQRF